MAVDTVEFSGMLLDAGGGAFAEAGGEGGGIGVREEPQDRGDLLGQGVGEG